MKDDGIDGGRIAGVSLLCKNLPIHMRPEEVRGTFARYGEVRDVYLPKDFYSGRPKGFGFIEFVDPRDADDAVKKLDGQLIGGREVSVMHSKQSRKTPRDMKAREEPHRYRRRSGSRSPRRRRSPSLPLRRRSSRSPLPQRSRSPLPRSRRRSRSHNCSPILQRSISPVPRRSRQSLSPRRRRSRSLTPADSASPVLRRSRSLMLHDRD